VTERDAGTTIHLDGGDESQRFEIGDWTFV